MVNCSCCKVHGNYGSVLVLKITENGSLDWTLSMRLQRLGTSGSTTPRYSWLAASPLTSRKSRLLFSLRSVWILEQKRDCSQSSAYPFHPEARI